MVNLPPEYYETAEDVLLRVRKILRCKEGESITARAEYIMGFCGDDLDG